MKKILALGLTSLMMVAILTGCGKSKYLLDVDYSDYVELCDYKGVEATKVVYDVAEEDIQGEIEYYLYDYVEYVPVKDRGIQVGDYAVITYTAMIDGKENEDYSGEDEEILVGEGYLYPDLEDALIGMKTGETKKVDVELTEEYAEEDLIGKTATMEVTIGEITIEELPEYNLDFVKENTDYETMEEYEAYIKQTIEENKKQEYKTVAVEEMLTYLVDNSKFNGYPDELYTKCEELYNNANEEYAAMYGMEVDEFLSMLGVDEEAKKQEIEANVNYELLIGAIATQEGIDCKEKEVIEYVEGLYEEYGYATPEEFFEDYGYESQEAFLEEYEMEIGYDLIYEKVCDFLYENAKLVEMDESEYLELQDEEYYEDVEEETTEEVDDESLSTLEDLESGLEEAMEESLSGSIVDDSSEVMGAGSTTEATTTETTTTEEVAQ